MDTNTLNKEQREEMTFLKLLKIIMYIESLKKYESKKSVCNNFASGLIILYPLTEYVYMFTSFSFIFNFKLHVPVDLYLIFRRIYIYKRLKWFVKQHQVHKTK
jgi:hypothetical protein